MSANFAWVGLLAERQPGPRQGEGEAADEPRERWIAVERGVVGLGRVDVATYGRARSVLVGNTLR